jgi:hypothetical protein
MKNVRKIGVVEFVKPLWIIFSQKTIKRNDQSITNSIISSSSHHGVEYYGQ